MSKADKPRIQLILDDDSLAADLESVLAHNCRHHVQLLSLDSWHSQDSLEQASLMLIACQNAEVVVDVCKTYRQAGGMAPILVVLNDASTAQRIKILDAGADEYVLQPLNDKELAASVDVLLRRPPVIYQSILTVGEISMDTLTGKVRKGEQEIHLSPMEFNLLEFFMQHPDTVFSSQFLWQHIWKSTSRSCNETVRTHIKTLRIKLDTPGLPSIIATVRARGYRLEQAAKHPQNVGNRQT